MSEEDKKIIAGRIQQILDTKSMKPADLAKVLGMPYQTVLNYSKGDREPKWDFIRQLYLYGVNPRWLLTGEGSMFQDGKNLPDSEQEQNSLLAQWVDEYMATHTKHEIYWLEVEVAKRFPAFNDWLVSKGHEPIAKQDWFDRMVSPLILSLPAEQQRKISQLLDEMEKDDSTQKP